MDFFKKIFKHKSRKYEPLGIEINPIIYNSDKLERVTLNMEHYYGHDNFSYINKDDLLAILKRNFSENVEETIEKYIKIEDVSDERKYKLSIEFFIPKKNK